MSTVTDIWKDCKKIADSIASSESQAFANKSIVLFAIQSFTWKTKPAGSGFASSTPMVLLFLVCCCSMLVLYLDADPQSFKGSVHFLEKRSELGAVPGPKAPG